MQLYTLQVVWGYGMSNLPNPTEFTKHKATFIPIERSQTGSKGYDLVQMDKSFKYALTALEEQRKHKLGNALISWNFWDSCSTKDASFKYFGYSKKYDSATVHLYNDAGEIKTIAIRDASGTKWKTFGSKKFIPYKIKDEIIFLASGMAEIIINDLLGISFIGVQADGMVQHLPSELKLLARDKYIVILSDNDTSFKEKIPVIQKFFEYSQTIIIDFEKVLDRELTRGYDFRDFVNEIGDAPTVLQMLEDEILTKGSDV